MPAPKGNNKGKKYKKRPKPLSHRGTDYIPEYDDLVYKLYLLKATDAEVADIIGVTEATIANWKLEHPTFLESTKKGKQIADANVSKSLYHRAVGYEHKEDKIFNNSGEPLIVPTIKHYPPDTQAASLWLRNRQPDKWRDKTELDHTSKGERINNINVTIEEVGNQQSKGKDSELEA